MFAKAMLIGSSQAGLFKINDSLRFNDDDSAYLSRTPASAGNRKTWTWSGWVKRGNLGSYQTLFGQGTGSVAAGYGAIRFDNNDVFRIFASPDGGVSSIVWASTAVYRDSSAWYHVVATLDTTLAAGADRFKLYVNGILQAGSFSTTPALNADIEINRASAHQIGVANASSLTNYLDGYLSDVHFIDGQALDPSRFGKQDADGVWQPISYTGTYGTNGFHLDFSDNSTAAALGTDVSGNGNDWTPSGITTDDQVADTPSVNYCTLNPVDPRTTGTLSNGNLVTTGNAAVTMRPSTGEYYYEKDGVGVSYDTSVSGPFDPVLPAGSYNFGQLPWVDTGPTGAEVALNSSNLPAPTITDGKAHFAPALYTGNGTTQAIGGLEFQPDFVWIKNRDAGYSHWLQDAVRGAQKQLNSDNTNLEYSYGNVLASFDTNGFTVNSSVGVNAAGQRHVAWNWNAGGSTVTNTDGTITSQVRANTTAGFSIVSYSQGASGSTVGHGLGAAPDIVIVKSRTVAPTNWPVYHSSLGKDLALELNQTNAAISLANYWGASTPSSTTFGVSLTGYGNNTGDMIAYCFHSVDGFSKFGSYTGNGSTDGPFVYTGFRPAFVLVKNYSNSGNGWIMIDTTRSTYNQSAIQIYANSASAEAASTANVDILSNGFKPRTGSSDINDGSIGYIYMAFAENPFKKSRAR